MPLNIVKFTITISLLCDRPPESGTDRGGDSRDDDGDLQVTCHVRRGGAFWSNSLWCRRLRDQPCATIGFGPGRWVRRNDTGGRAVMGLDACLARA